VNIFLIIILAVLIGNYILNLIVEKLNLQHIKTELPKEFEGYYDAEKYKKSQNYLKESTQFEIRTDTILTSITIAFILMGGFNLVDRIARGFGFGDITTGLIFVGILLLASHIIHIPLSAYSTFFIEEKYGFNRTTLKTFILDILKILILTAIIGGIIFFAVLWFFGKMGTWAWVYCWCLVTFFQIFLTFIAPVVIMPLFNKFVPLEECELKTTIENYTNSQNFRIKGIFTMDGSRRSSKSNAFFTGFGRFRRIVLYDTLIEKHTTDELASIVAHEMGHYKKKHIVTHLIISIITSGIMFFILSLFLNNRQLFDAFKMEETSIYASLFFFGFLYAPIEMIISVFINMLSRKNEYEADEYAVSTHGKPEAMILSLKKLSVDNLSNLTPHPAKVFLTYSHPPVLERIKKIREHTIDPSI
jgi:STE24 endopeptidase